MRNNRCQVSRRDAMKFATAGAAATVAWPAFSSAVRAQNTLTLADIGVGDPGDWSKFTDATGHGVNVVSMGNAPSAVVNQLLTGGGRTEFDIVNIVGGMQEPLVENDLIRELDVARIPNWADNSYIQNYLAPGTPGFQFIGYNDVVYGVPTVLQGDSFAYLPDETGELDSFGALFDPAHRGFVSLEDNYTTAGQKTALFLNQSGQADIANPADMTPEEVRAVVDFLIEQKRAGQFRVIWSSFEQAVNLITSKEVHVIDCWEPMVFVARDQGTNAVYAAPKEGYLLWAMGAYIVNDPDAGEDDLDGTYELLNFMLGGWYGAKIALLRGYMTNPLAIKYARSHPEEFTAEEAERVAEIIQGVQAKFEKGGTWQNRWPTYVDVYEEEWQRFKSA
jgi:putative spermidine/putrescine transport system substrate-binding protein